MKKFLFISSIAIILVVSGCSKIDQNQDVEKGETLSNNVSQTELYESKEGFEVYFPKSWDYRENVGGVYNVIFVSQPKNKNPLSAGMVSFHIYKFPGNHAPSGGDISLDAVYASTRSGIEKDYKILREEDIKIDGVPAKKIIFQGVDNGEADKMQEIIFIKNRVSYTIIYTSILDYFDEFYKEAESIITSFKSE